MSPMSRMAGFFSILKKDRGMQKRLIGVAAFTLAFRFTLPVAGAASTDNNNNRQIKERDHG
jgi:hypothetical protein